MLKSHEKFYAAHGKRMILVADDELVNREILGMILENEFKVIYAADGQETIEQIINNKDELSMVLLDLMMPVKSGIEVLKEVKESAELKHIPIIVLTADQNAEVESLNIGAIDYIPKPYPQGSIILARINRALELSEDRDIISVTERDPLTGLYNKEFFYHYAEQYDQHHKDVEMDAIVIDINHFHMINERFGTAYGDEILKGIAQKIKESVTATEGIVCRMEADTFMVYCIHGMDYRTILDNAAIGMSGDESINNRVRLRLGVYENVDKSLDIERRFDRAKMAADTVRNNFTKNISIYDDKLHENELFAEQLIDDFHQAMAKKQFIVYYQPKFDIRPKEPVLSSMEALVRWQHPERGFISPGLFIRLFEENGLIQELDTYVWNETARQIREWKDKLGFSVPVSVNVSRIDMYDPELLNKFNTILDDHDLTVQDLLLEITESAYTQDSDQIIETVNTLRNMGFRIEMDDFGTGYSSLNMISSLPIDALKLDMHFVQNAFKDRKDTRMVEVIIDIADHLNVPVIAEGVEKVEHLVALKDLGCDIVQGYYFSKPVPAEECEKFIIARKDLTPEELVPEVFEEVLEPVEKQSEAEPEPAVRKKAIELKKTNYAFAILAFVFAVLLIICDIVVTNGYKHLNKANSKYVAAVNAANELETGSDYLTEQIRLFVLLGKIEYLDNYFEEAFTTNRRDNAVAKLEELLNDNNKEAYDNLAKALDYSNELMVQEYNAMRLAQLAYGLDDSLVPSEISSFVLSPEEETMNAEEKITYGMELLTNDEYLEQKNLIRRYVKLCTDSLIVTSVQDIEDTERNMTALFVIQIILLVFMIISVICEVIFITSQIRIPLTNMVKLMRSQQKVPPAGAEELRFVTETYNEILEESQKTQTKLSYEASHDALTGLFNRSAYEMFMESLDLSHIALLIIDVDHFKVINDTYGHDVGDMILKKVAQILTESFRSVDMICRFGGDEFVVIMTRANSSMSQLVINKIARANEKLQDPKDGLPKTSLSVGVAFSDRENPQGSIFKDADTALYKVKEAGKCGCAVY